MARTIKELPPRSTKYPWHQWANGETWEAEFGADFDITPEAFQKYVVLVAIRLGREIDTQRDGNKVSFTFGRRRKPNPKRRKLQKK